MTAVTTRRHKSSSNPPWKLGTRILLAATCLKCGRFCQNKEFGRHRRNYKDKHPYIDRRCVNCKWGARVKASKSYQDQLTGPTK
jgi:hypothetical protein